MRAVRVAGLGARLACCGSREPMCFTQDLGSLRLSVRGLENLVQAGSLSQASARLGEAARWGAHCQPPIILVHLMLATTAQEHA